uniref:Phospholipid-transporting ATPase n=1 Tax=Arcella intermedia TaxID=1963864 RepID=A0A6B2KYB5_9EUKA
MSGSTAKKQSLMTESDSLFLAGLKDFWTYFALLNYLIPLSLVVSLDIVRFIQSSFIQWDVEMDCNGQCSSANTSNLNEELALVDYVLSDKTGTLTENIMNFKKASINGIVREGDFPELIQRPIDETTKYFTTHFLYAISLAHSCQIIESHDKKMVKSPSPDEEALCSAAEESGFILKKRTPKQITLEVFGQMEVFEILLEMPFTPERRRMFVIVKGPDDKIVLYTKGADTAITELMDMQDGKNVQRLQATQMDTKGFAHQGYRTLFIAMKEISEKEFMSYASEFENISPNSKEAEVLFSKLSSGLTLIGSTAIEDRLQPGVAATVTSLRMAGIRIWMITGDNLETAVTIGYASNLISSEMEVVRLDGSLNTWGVLHNTLKAFVTNNPEQRQFALVLDGNTLDFILSNYRADFVSVARYAACTICSRVTPSQKADVVSLLQNNLSVVCLAIGDGGNDVSMLQQAQVGVGILGREGNQASRAADFAVPQFRCLGRLLLIHGRYSLLRNTKLIYQFFYKNLCSFMPSVWFAFVSGASGVTPFDPWSMLFYNTIYTALPYLSLGLFEKDLDEEIVMKNPRVYRDHKKLESRPLFHWMSNAVFHSLIIFFGCWAIFQDKSFYENGLMPDIDTFGSVLLFTSFHVVLFKYLLETSYWVSWTLFSFFVSLLVFYILQIIISLYVSSLSNAFVMMLSSGTVWLWLILAIPTCLIGDVTFKYLRREIYPKATHILQERSQRSDKKTRTQDSKSIPLLNIFPPGNESYERL